MGMVPVPAAGASRQRGPVIAGGNDGRTGRPAWSRRLLEGGRTARSGHFEPRGDRLATCAFCAPATADHRSMELVGAQRDGPQRAKSQDLCGFWTLHPSRCVEPKCSSRTSPAARLAQAEHGSRPRARAGALGQQGDSPIVGPGTAHCRAAQLQMPRQLAARFWRATVRAADKLRRLRRPLYQPCDILTHLGCEICCCMVCCAAW